MSQLASLLANGLAIGALYALIALGLVLIFKCSGVVSFTHSSLVLLGAFLVATFDASWGFVAAAAGGLGLTACIAAGIDAGVLSRRTGAPPISRAIITIGIDIIALTFVTQQLGARLLNIDHPWAEARWNLGATTMTANRGIGLLVAATLVLALYLLFTRSAWGMSMRAVAEDAEAASLMGLSRGAITATTWAGAGALACLAGVFMTGSPTPGVTTTVAVVALKAFPAAILGGLDSVRGAIVGGLLIGVAESLVAGYQTELTFVGSGFSEIVPFVLMLAVLVVRPAGLFGSREMTRV